jgi:uncharacterized RDD family membrane protein YckC
MCGAALTGAAVSPAAFVAAAASPAQMAPEALHAPAAEARYAGFWRRFAAFALDNLLLFFPLGIARALMGLPVSGYGGDSGDMRETTIGMCGLVLSWLYCALQESSAAGGTLGQRSLGMRVTDTHGRRISFGRASGRYFAQLLTFLTCSTGYLLQLWTARRQSLHDLASGCVFVVQHPAPAGAVPGTIESEGHA